MSFLNRVANGLGTLLGVLAETTSQVIATVKRSYAAYRDQAGISARETRQDADRKKDRLREINDEIIALRQRGMSRGHFTDAEQKRWNDLKAARVALREEVEEAREVKAAEKIIETEDRIEKVEVVLETSHVLQFNAFADALGKDCPRCGRRMKLQWERTVTVARPNDFFWGCTGYYIVLQDGRRACRYTEHLQRNDYGLMTDVTQPEFSLSSQEFGIILADPGTRRIITERVDDLREDLSKSRRGVELATCPVHGEGMVLKRKSNPNGLLDAYFLACPRWLPHDQGCTYIEKLKSGSQLAALLQAQTGRGIL